MITKLSIRNFKCLDAAEIRLGKITVLAGLNGMGKSSVIQSLLVLLQSDTDQPNSMAELVCNGSLTSLGTPKDVLWEGAKDESISFGIVESENPERNFKFILFQSVFDAHPVFRWKDGSSGASGRGRLPDRDGSISRVFDIKKFQYLHAERWGPRTSFPVSSVTAATKMPLGRDGELTAQYLSSRGHGGFRVADPMLHPNAVSDQLVQQAEAWLGEVSPGTRIFTETHADLDLVSLAFAFSSKLGETNHYRPTNVGFGISYILPIIVAALSATEGTLLLLENPEAHLHPRGQRKMGELLALAAMAGAQVVVETHSDHFLNGLRLSVHGGKLPADDVAIHFFERELTDHTIRAKITSPVMDRDGRIDQWPDGFFDEGEKALRELLLPPKKADG